MILLIYRKTRKRKKRGSERDESWSHAHRYKNIYMYIHTFIAYITKIEKHCTETINSRNCRKPL